MYTLFGRSVGTPYRIQSVKLNVLLGHLSVRVAKVTDPSALCSGRVIRSEQPL